jgi:hypothetical protein
MIFPKISIRAVVPNERPVVRFVNAAGANEIGLTRRFDLDGRRELFLRAASRRPVGLRDARRDRRAGARLPTMAMKASEKTATAAAIALAAGDLACFSALTWPRFELAHHHRQIIEQLEAIERGDISRLMIFLPPRHGKSLLGSQLFPAWYLGRHPDHSIIAASYGSELAVDFGRRVRNLVAAPVYGAIFPQAKMASDSASAHRFSLLSGGGYFALGAGGAITGRGANLLLIDDPTKSAADANSDAYRRSLHEWFVSTAYTRLQGDNAAIVIVATRWHMDDLPGWLLREHAEENWTVLSLPAFAETDEGWRKEGDALWPKRFALKRLEQMRATVGGAAWASLYQQRPAAAEGASSNASGGNSGLRRLCRRASKSSS